MLGRRNDVRVARLAGEHRTLQLRALTNRQEMIARRKQGDLPPVMERVNRVYQYLTMAQPLAFHGGSWRLSESVAAALALSPFLELCRRYSISAKPCKTNLIATP